MPKELASTEPGGTPVRGRNSFKRRELRLPDGGSLVLTAGGSIDHLSDDGTTIQSWAPDDADWARQAFRFGVQPRSNTVTPHGRQRWDMRPPRQ
ncbi:MAG TPA: hypothetical protein VIM30_14765 [Candidatus Limnocylindrales bacterium]|jgi:hypothetical protein